MPEDTALTQVFNVSVTCIPNVVGCMNPVATNYDPAATIACSGCCVLPGCTSGVGANSESFESFLIN